MIFLRIVAAGAGASRRVVFMSDVHESNIENIHDMLVVERVEDIFALTAAFYEVIIFEQLELVRNRGFCHIDRLSDVIDADFIISYRAKYFHSCFVAEHFEKSSGASYEFF